MANIKADEISKILREQIENYQQTVAVEEVGSVISVGDGIARIHGLEKAMAGEALIGRVVNPLGEPVDDKGPTAASERSPLERIAPGVLDRQPVREPLQ